MGIVFIIENFLLLLGVLTTTCGTSAFSQRLFIPFKIQFRFLLWCESLPGVKSQQESCTIVAITKRQKAIIGHRLIIFPGILDMEILPTIRAAQKKMPKQSILWFKTYCPQCTQKYAYTDSYTMPTCGVEHQCCQYGGGPNKGPLIVAQLREQDLIVVQQQSINHCLAALPSSY